MGVWCIDWGVVCGCGVQIGAWYVGVVYGLARGVVCGCSFVVPEAISEKLRAMHNEIQ